MAKATPRAMEQAIASIKRDVDSAQLSLDDVKSISTGSLAVDLVTGIGGFPMRRISEVSGWESSGKTTLCLTAAARAQREGLFVAYIDVEHALDKAHAARIGFDYQDESKGFYIATETVEQTLDVVMRLIETDQCHLIIVDSVPAMVPAAEFEKDAVTDSGGIASRARMLSTSLPKLVGLINKHDTALVFINQMRMKINTGFASRFKPVEEQATGGSALRFYASVRLFTKLAKKGAVTRKELHALTGKEEDIPLANLHRIEAIKNKMSAPYREAEYYIRYDTSGVYGIDNITTVVFMAVARNVISKKGGGYFQYAGKKSNFSMQGDDKVYQHLYDNPDVLREICDTLGIDPRSL